MNVCIVGGGTAGTEVARKLRFLDKSVEIILIDEFGLDQYSPCSLPYYIEGVMDSITIYNRYEDDAITYYRGFKPIKRTGNILTISDFKVTKDIEFDHLVIATGSRAIHPKITGLKESVVVKTKQDADELKTKQGPFLIIGGGYIGCELAGSLIQKNVVTLIEKKERILHTFEKDMSQIVHDYLTDLGVDIQTNKPIDNLTDNYFNGKKYETIICCVGFEPNTEVLDICNVSNDCDEYFQVANSIYVIGDLAKTRNRQTNKIEHSYFANSAVKHADIVAHHILQKPVSYLGFVLNAVSKIGELQVGITGLSKKDVSDCIIGKFIGFDKYETCGGKKYVVKVFCDNAGIIQGCQIIGNTDVAGRLNMVSLAIRQKLRVHDIVETDTCYNPCVSSIHDPLIEAAKICVKKLALQKK